VEALVCPAVRGQFFEKCAGLFASSQLNFALILEIENDRKIVSWRSKVES
jgi:hypothetical protein